MAPENAPSSWIDISMRLRSGMGHWPGDPDVSIERICSIESGDEFNLSKLSMCAHTGTHMDSPLHYFAEGADIGAMPLDACIGRARVIEVDDPVSIRREELDRHGIRPGERILFKTRNSAQAAGSDSFLEDFVYLSPGAARLLAHNGVRTVGIDYLSVGPSGHDGTEVHRLLLAAGIWIIEGLDLRDVSPGDYELICLPLRIPGAEGAPARAILKKAE